MQVSYTNILITLLSIAVILCIKFCISTTYGVFVYPLYRSPLRHLPGPKNGFFWGQTLNFLRAKSANELPIKFMKENPKTPLIYYRHITNSEWLLVNSVRACRELLQTKCYEFEKPGYFRRVIGEIAGKGLVNEEGNKHKSERKVLNEQPGGLPSIANVRRIVPVFNEKAQELTSRINVHNEETSEASINGKYISCSIEMHSLISFLVSEIFSKTTLDIIGRASLGVELNSISVEGSTFSQLYHRIFNQPPAGQIISLINMFIPVRWLPVQANLAFVNANRETRRLIREIIRERKREIFRNRVESNDIREEFTRTGSKDFLTYMLYEKGQGANGWSEDDILGHLRAEIREKIPSDESPTYTNLESLDYMSLFLKEVVRCFSPSVMITRKPSHDHVTLCNIPIPKSTTILLNPQSLQFNPAIWGPDAEIFDPYRHADNDPRAKQYPDSKDPYAIATFSNGPRICIGKHFASLEMRSLLVEILRNFELVRGWDDRGQKLRDGVGYEGGNNIGSDIFAGVKVRNSITLKPENGVWVRFKHLESDNNTF
ncbi:cytochrome P450 [Dendryphion nanum]|uniref:Cytochrome P450 n=1 Tax=Dendryphion nanum TaxID=256645 RepID=A0A9P9ID02_9PLEO|nr:cytochrome P450 [Dendryphion nanum]